MSDVPIYTKAEMDAQLDRISALSAELEAVKGEIEARDAEIAEWEHTSKRWDEWAKERADKLAAAEAKLAGGEAVDVRHFNILAEAMAEVKATSDGLSDQSIVEIVAGCIEEINALTHPAPTHEDGSGEAADPEECGRTAAFWGAEAIKAMLQGDGDEAKRCLARSKRHALNAVRIRAIASGGKQ